MPLPDAPRRTRSTLLRVAAYYVILSAVATAGVRRFPLVAAAVAGPAAQLPGGAGGRDLLSPPAAFPGTGALEIAFLGLISMLGALAIMVPVTWIYLLTRQRRGYEESVVHTLLILPVAVAGIVAIVQNSLALAFSLAGIVAAVRFRTTLEDTKDAVYVFLAIGVGVAAGAQQLALVLCSQSLFRFVDLGNDGFG